LKNIGEYHHNSVLILVPVNRADFTCILVIPTFAKTLKTLLIFKESFFDFAKKYSPPILYLPKTLSTDVFIAKSPLLIVWALVLI